MRFMITVRTEPGRGTWESHDLASLQDQLREIAKNIDAMSIGEQFVVQRVE